MSDIAMPSTMAFSIASATSSGSPCSNADVYCLQCRSALICLSVVTSSILDVFNSYVRHSKHSMKNNFPAKPRIGISACLLGSKVRYDGGHKKDLFLTETFGPHVEWVSVCPEVEFGMGVPRESVRLVSARSEEHTHEL